MYVSCAEEIVRLAGATMFALIVTASALVGEAGETVIALIVGVVAVTVSVKLLVAVAAPSFAVTVIVDVPV